MGRPRKTDGIERDHTAIKIKKTLIDEVQKFADDCDPPAKLAGALEFLVLAGLDQFRMDADEDTELENESASESLVSDIPEPVRGN